MTQMVADRATSSKALATPAKCRRLTSRIARPPANFRTSLRVSVGSANALYKHFTFTHTRWARLGVRRRDLPGVGAYMEAPPNKGAINATGMCSSAMHPRSAALCERPPAN